MISTLARSLPVLLAIANARPGGVQAAGPVQPPGRPAPRETMLCIARSADGITFDDTGRVLARAATAPDVEVLPNGQIMAVFDQARDGNADATTLTEVRSWDDGWTWSSPRRVYVRRGNRALRDVRHGDLVAQLDGELRLYFATTVGGGRGRAGQALISSAATRDGRQFTLDPATRIRADHDEVHPIVSHRSGYTHLFAVAPASSSSRQGARISVDHFLSRDGRRFAALRRTGSSPADFLGSIVASPTGLRLYTSSPAGVVSLMSRDGRTWHPEPGVRLAHGWDPAVTRLPDGSFLMIYCAAMDTAGVPTTTLAETAPEEPLDLQDAVWEELADADDAGDFDGAETTERPPDTGVPADLTDSTDTELVDAEESTESIAPSDATPPNGDARVVAVAAPADESAQSEGDAGTSAGAGASSGDDTTPGRMPLEDWLASAGGFEDWEPLWSDGFCPPPDFQTKVDYFRWYAEHALTQPEDNAYDAYARFIPGPNDPPGSKPEWPQFKDMFHDDSFDGPPAPWDPADHPDWNVTSPEVRLLLSSFRDAAMHEGYASPPITEADLEGRAKVDEPILAGILLPSLSGHRTLAKATLADAWRQEDGKVSPQQMLDAWETTLRSASHLSQGATLIEELVGTAIRRLTHETARWALKHDVFSAGELPRALDTLQRYDKTDKDPVEALRGEHAFAMDLVQYLFSPPTPDGAPRVNPERVDRIADWFEPQGTVVDRVKTMQPEAAYTSIDAFDTYYRQLTEHFRIGYPDVRAADADALAQQATDATPMTELFLPSLGRYYKLKTRAETVRRATELAYALHIHRARAGHWPESLSELDPEFGERMRTDPFTGAYFGYRLTDDGPIIYSLSENAVDDGGVHSPRWDDEITNDAGSDDYVFWPPQPD